MGLIAIAVLAIALAIGFNKKFEETIAFSFMILMLILYAVGSFMKLSAGFIVALLVSGFSMIFVLYRIAVGKGSMALRSSLLTWGTLAVALYTGYFWYFSFHRDFSHPDELYCWGLMAKNYYYYDQMFSPLSTALSADQTPILPLLSFFFARAGMEFNDPVCYFAQCMFTISLLVPAFDHIGFEKNVFRFITLFLSFPSLMVLSGLEAFRYILGDMVLAAGMCFFIMQIFRFIEKGDHFYYISGLTMLLTLCLTKRMGPVFASMALFISVPLLIKRNALYIRELSGMMAAIGLITLSWFGFSIYALMPVCALAGGLILNYISGRLSECSERYRNAIYIGCLGFCMCAVAGYMIVFLGRRGAYAYAVMARFMKDMISISAEDGYLRLSYGIYVLICFLASMGIGYLHRLKADSPSGVGSKEVSPETETYSLAFIYTGIAMVIYSLFMLYMHIWQIGPSNNNMEGLIDRYMIPMEILAVFLLLYIFLIRSRDMKLVILFAALIALLCVSDSGELYRQFFAKHQCIGYKAFEDAGIELTSDDLVYFIDEQNYFSYSDREFYYCMWPARTNFIDQIFMGNNGRVEFDADELKTMIVSEQYLEIPYDYLYLQTIDDDFADRYGELFERVEDIHPGRAYRVITDGSNLTLKLIP